MTEMWRPLAMGGGVLAAAAFAPWLLLVGAIYAAYRLALTAWCALDLPFTTPGGRLRGEGTVE